MNFFKRFSSTENVADAEFEDAGVGGVVGGAPAPSMTQSMMGSNAFTASFQTIANKVSSTISAPTSPVKSHESLARALERNLANAAINDPPPTADTTFLLVVDNHNVDWSKYFRTKADVNIRVVQAELGDIDVASSSTDGCTIEVEQPGKDIRRFKPALVYIRGRSAKPWLRPGFVSTLISAGIPLLNSTQGTLAFLNPPLLRARLEKLRLPSGGRLPFLPRVYYPNFHKFQVPEKFPVVVTVAEGNNGEGKMRINTLEELRDLEGTLRLMPSAIHVAVEPFVDTKFDVHIQRVDNEVKTILRKAIGGAWKSNTGSAVLEQTHTKDRHKEWLATISTELGGLSILSIDVLVDKDGREWIHSVDDCLGFLGEQQEDDRRAIAQLIRRRLGPVHHGPPPAHPPQSPPNAEHVNGVQPVNNRHPSVNGYPAPTTPATPQNGRAPPPPPARRPSQNRMPSRESSRDSLRSAAPQEPPPSLPQGSHSQVQPKLSSSAGSFADDTMGQLKRTFAGIFGDVS